MDTTTIDKKEVLLLAKKETYAAINQALFCKDKMSIGSKPLEFDHAVRWSHAPFGGQEILFKKSSVAGFLTPIWYLNFTGVTFTDNHYLAETIFDFLRSALSKVNENFPFRGPQTFQSGDLIYRSNYIGNINHFSGDEEIHLNGIVVYRGHYFGGTVSEKQILDIDY